MAESQSELPVEPETEEDAAEKRWLVAIMRQASPPATLQHGALATMVLGSPRAELVAL